MSSPIFNWTAFLPVFTVGFNLFASFALPMIFMCLLVAATFWIMSVGFEKMARTYLILSKRRPRASHRRLSRSLPGADSQPDTPAPAIPAIADPVPAAEDVQAEKQTGVTETRPNELRSIPEAPGSWHEALLRLPAHLCPDTEETFYAPVMHNADQQAFMPHPKLKFYGTADRWAHICRRAELYAIDSEEECRKIQSMNGKPTHLRICGAPYALDWNYKPLTVAAE